MILSSIVFLVVTIAVCTINLASITLSKPVERLLYEMKEDVVEETTSSEESADTTAFEEALEGGPIEQDAMEESKEEEIVTSGAEMESHSGKDTNRKMDSVSKQHDAFSKAYSKKKHKSVTEEEEVKKPSVGMSFDDGFSDFGYDDEEEEEEYEDLSAESIGYGKAINYEDANSMIENIMKAGVKDEEVES